VGKPFVVPMTMKQVVANGLLESPQLVRNIPTIQRILDVPIPIKTSASRLARAGWSIVALLTDSTATNSQVAQIHVIADNLIGQHPSSLVVAHFPNNGVPATQVTNGMRECREFNNRVWKAIQQFQYVTPR
jgi:hypothetical protein